MKTFLLLIVTVLSFAPLSAQNIDGLKNLKSKSLEKKMDQKMQTLQNNVDERMKNLQAYIQNEKDWNEIIIGKAVETPISEAVDTTTRERIEPMLAVPNYVDNKTTLETELALIKIEIEQKVDEKPIKNIPIETETQSKEIATSAKTKTTIKEEQQEKDIAQKKEDTQEFKVAELGAKKQVEIEKEKANLLIDEKKLIPSTPPITDKYFISSEFGKRFHPKLLRYKFHNGIDLAAVKGTPVYATANGTVVKSGNNGNYGNYILIQHANGYETAYAHLNSIEIKEGMQLKQGDKIGTVGSTGMSTGNHLHYEIIKNKKRVNPKSFI